MVILPDTDKDSAGQIAERLRERIEKLNLAHAYSETKSVITISAGVATQTELGECLSSIMLHDSADKALYMAKAGGRNRVYCL